MWHMAMPGAGAIHSINGAPMATLRGACPPVLPGAALPVTRRRCDHFTTPDGATLNASATARTVSPASSRAIARARMSIERGFVMRARLHIPASAMNQKSQPEEIPAIHSSSIPL
jgi:hypothetical protein